MYNSKINRQYTTAKRRMPSQVQRHKRDRPRIMGFWTALTTLLVAAACSSPPGCHAVETSPIAYTVLPNTTPTPEVPAGGGGPIDDTQCNIEELEQANDSQLYTILQELVTRTEFFQHFAVDLDQTCPLSAQEKNKEDNEDTEEEEELIEAMGGKIPTTKIII